MTKTKRERGGREGSRECVCQIEKTFFWLGMHSNFENKNEEETSVIGAKNKFTSKIFLLPISLQLDSHSVSL